MLEIFIFDIVIFLKFFLYFEFNGYWVFVLKMVNFEFFCKIGLIVDVFENCSGCRSILLDCIVLWEGCVDMINFFCFGLNICFVFLLVDRWYECVIIRLLYFFEL